jgi:hypothetical protein
MMFGRFAHFHLPKTQTPLHFGLFRHSSYWTDYGVPLDLFLKITKRSCCPPCCFSLDVS